MISVEETKEGKVRVLLEDPPLARTLFQSTTSSGAWLLVRVWVGWQLLGAGTHQLADRPSLSLSSQALEAYWRSALAATAPASGSTVDDWLRGVMSALLSANAQYWIAGVTSLGQIVLGIALILGIFTGIMAAAAVLLQWVIVLIAGDVYTDPFVTPLAILLLLAWKNAGYVGFDRYLLRRFGAPWWDTSVRWRRGGMLGRY